MGKKLLILIAAIAVAVAYMAPATAQESEAEFSEDTKAVEESETGSYVVVMAADPLVAEFAQEELGTPAAKAEAAAIEQTHDEVLADAGVTSDSKVQDYTNALNGFSAVLDYDEAVAVAADPKVALVQPDELLQLDTESSPKFIGLTKGGEAWKSGLTGEGVVVGVIDSGIWPEHPSFADDGSYPAPPVVLDGSVRPDCEFGNLAHSPDDAPFTCNNKLIGARQMLDTYRSLIGADPDEFDSARDDDGHGTHTASTTAGNAGVSASIFGEPLGTISGIAPRAHVVAYKGLGNLGGFSSDLAAAIDQAVADGVDVINYSVGGGASLTGADEIAYLFAADAGVFVATSAGNSGPGPGTVGGPGNVPWITTVGANTQERFFEGTAQLYTSTTKKNKEKLKKSGEFEGASVTLGTGGALPLVDAEFAGGDLCMPGTLDPGAVAGNIVLCRRGAVDRAAKSLAVSLAGGAGMIMYNNSDDDNLFTDTHWVPSVHIDNTPGLEVKAFIASTPTPKAEIETGDTSKWKSAPSMTIFSSRGPNTVAEDIIKPDITAPGMQILAGNSPFPDPGSTPPGELFQAIAGTSMSSPHVAGVFALLKQAHPDWSPAAARSALMTTADPKVVDNDRSTQANPFGMGSGHLDPGKVKNKGSAFNPGLVYEAGFFDYLGFLCDAGPEAFSDPEGTCADLESIGVPTDASDLNYPSIGIAELAGSQTVTRIVASVADKTVKYKVKVHAPAGYDVTVSPSEITLAPGESASYQVTITNNGGGPVGEWRFGDLEWKGGGYTVRSPIAVKASLFDAPDEVSGAGAAGSTSFDVQFGYTGDYSAAPHGLVPPTFTSAAIGQDPDQTYPSGDDAPGPAGGVDKWAFPISGAAFVRFELVIPGPDDIDLFLEDSSGTIIAASTNGGTDELIELVLPPDDTYTMVVHGWGIPSAPLPYTLSSWVVSATPGGSLGVDSAPASAVLGAVEPVGVSWAGLAPGLPHLGAVSHSDAGGIIGLTLVNVDS